MRILDKFGNKTETPDGVCMVNYCAVADMRKCPIANFDDTGKNCVPTMCGCYSEDRAKVSKIEEG